MNTKYSFWLHGTGRWARILAQQLQILFGDNANLNFVTARDPYEISQELLKHGIYNFNVVTEFSPGETECLHLGIVCGQAKDNFTRVMNFLGAGLNVYVEKPFARNSKEAGEMIKFADQQNLVLYCSNAFLFNEHIHSLILDTSAFNDITKIRISWIDEKGLDFINGRPKYDVALPVYEDVLPHVLNIVGFILKTDKVEFIDIAVERFGQRVALQFRVSNIDLHLVLERNGGTKERILEIHSGNDKQAYDFSHRRLSNRYGLIEEIAISDKFGPLSVSLFDFVKSAENKKPSFYNDIKLAEKIIGLYPVISEKYLGHFLHEPIDETTPSTVNLEGDLRYLKAEVFQRINIACQSNQREDLDYVFDDVDVGLLRQVEYKLRGVYADKSIQKREP